MKKGGWLLSAIVLSQLTIQAQIITAKPNVIQKQQIETKSVAKQAVFRLSPFTSPVTYPSNAPSVNGTELNVGLKEFDLGNNVSGNTFVVPENGIYHFDVRMNILYPITDYQDYIRFYLMLNNNGSVVEKTILMNPQTALSPVHTLSISTTLMLKKGDAITASYNADTNSGTVKHVTASEVSFSGFKINVTAEGGSTEIIK